MNPDARQIPLPLPEKPALGQARFHVSEANRAAFEMIGDWQSWPGGRLVLTGPEGSGKTHLAHVWQDLSGAARIAAVDLTAEAAADLGTLPCVAVEDADRIAGDPPREAALFHLHNLLGASGGHLLVTGRNAPTRWEISLPDLASRLQAMALLQLGPPDDALLSSVLTKLLADRHVRAGPKLVPFLLKRIERSFSAAEAVVATLSKRAFEEGVPVGMDLARRVIQADGDGDDTPPEEG